ncbi:anthranilate phosphoribosyltransferase [Radiomyces spectabilis]|uniref:anthranilate phosphoribosyltransferase n=1 Tax=Radiomyces spectabilis TaxID=64574 RepID=UPI00221F0F4D|nr:anthranilate phosphoribosyltransferase [Radiomyces spectabilis]KAI8379522.1 anthranilate phosphoribosyltransferase [Radiomyces spectabilis]
MTIAMSKVNGHSEVLNIKSILKVLVHEPSQFQPIHAETAIHEIMAGRASHSQISAFLVALRLQQLDADPTIVAACATAMRSHARLIPYGDYEHIQGTVVDIVGTGGDGHNTYNVSTTASIVAAGAGAKVAKHGNRAASSKSGSADLMEAQGCHIHKIEPEQVPGILEQSNFCFLFSQIYHPSMKHVAALRKEIGVPTVFNLLGPMSNPAKPARVVVGVHSPQIGSLMANALKLTGVTEALVVCGAEKLDEISPAGETNFWKVHGSGDITTGTLHPTRDFGLKTHPLSDVKGGDCHENAVILRRLLNGELPENDPILDFVLLNAAALLYMAGIASDYKEGVQKARESILSGNAKRALEAFRKATGNLTTE